MLFSVVIFVYDDVSGIGARITIEVTVVVLLDGVIVFENHFYFAYNFVVAEDAISNGGLIYWCCRYCSCFGVTVVPRFLESGNQVILSIQTLKIEISSVR